MRIALTGASGFLGRHFVPAALAAGHRLCALERSRPVPGGVEAVRGGLEDPAARARLLEGADVLVHLAAAGVQGRDRAWPGMLQANVAAPVELAEEAARQGVRLVVAAGTCLEYRGHGRLPDEPCPPGARPRCDEGAPTGPADPYGATKAAGAILLAARARALGLPLTYLRFASLYGPGDDADKLLPAALRAALAGREFEMTAGEQVRDWLHVDDAVGVLLAAIAGAGAGIVNAGTGEGVAVRDLVARLFELAGAPAGRVLAGRRPYRPGEVHHLVLDPSRLRGELGYTPRTALEAGLAGLVQGAGAATGARG